MVHKNIKGGKVKRTRGPKLALNAHLKERRSGLGVKKQLDIIHKRRNSGKI